MPDFIKREVVGRPLNPDNVRKGAKITTDLVSREAGRKKGIDLTKDVFQIHRVNQYGKPVLRKQMRREQAMAFFANVPPCMIGMEACSSTYHWVRKLQEFGHPVRLMAPQFVKPCDKRNKNDAADAKASQARSIIASSAENIAQMAEESSTAA